jgi:cytochrome bd-type quinol oxidase subunit 2
VTRAARFALIVIIAHAVIASLHATAHRRLGIELSQTQVVFVSIVIIVAPLLAGLLIWKDAQPWGALLLAFSMAGAFLFGVVNHFLLVSPDHVQHLPGIQGTPRVLMFQLTAVLLALIEALGVVAGIMALKREVSGQYRLR